MIILGDETGSEIQENNPLTDTDQTLGAKRAIVIWIFYFVVQILFGLVAGIAVGSYFAVFQNADPENIKEFMTSFAVLAGLFGIVLASFVAFRMTRRTLRGPIRQGALAPLGWRPSRVAVIAAAAVTGCILSLVYLYVLVVLIPPGEQQNYGPLTTAAISGGWARIFWAILALALAPPTEEFIFRGVLLEGLSNTIGIRAAALIVTVVFVALHAMEARGYWPALVSITLLAFALILFRIKSGSLLPGITAHVSYNLVLVIYTYTTFT